MCEVYFRGPNTEPQKVFGCLGNIRDRYVLCFQTRRNAVSDFQTADFPTWHEICMLLGITRSRRVEVEKEGLIYYFEILVNIGDSPIFVNHMNRELICRFCCCSIFDTVKFGDCSALIVQMMLLFSTSYWLPFLLHC